MAATTPKSKPYSISIQSSYKPFPMLWHASKTLREIAGSGVDGSRWVSLGALTTLAFAIEAFCQTEGPLLFGEQWLGERRIEKEPVHEKLRLIAASAGVEVNYGRSPWQQIRRVLRARNALAHPKPTEKQRRGVVHLEDGEHPMDKGLALVAEHWETLLDLDTATQVAGSVEQGLKLIWKGLGKAEWKLFADGGSSYMMSAHVPPAPRRASKSTKT
ncbi:hypothetical protein LJR084_001188 [Variovorax sp. LjRoot84]|uniref:hypothetical protein n=1 Tax=Variovorax sp. LjRoot84 TaxID=3342340 RepID=UPI003ECDA529